jgi:hypothetical protein
MLGRLSTLYVFGPTGTEMSLADYGIISVSWPAMVKVITPPHMHMS